MSTALFADEINVSRIISRQVIDLGITVSYNILYARFRTSLPAVPERVFRIP